MMQEKQPFDQWAILEIMGHVRFAGRVTEEVIAGAALLRLDVPEIEGQPAFTKFFGASAIYSITPCGEETCRAAVGAFKKRPVDLWELPRALPAGRVEDEADDIEPNW